MLAYWFGFQILTWYCLWITLNERVQSQDDTVVDIWPFCFSMVRLCVYLRVLYRQSTVQSNDFSCLITLIQYFHGLTHCKVDCTERKKSTDCTVQPTDCWLFGQAVEDFPWSDLE